MIDYQLINKVAKSFYKTSKSTIDEKFKSDDYSKNYKIFLEKGFKECVFDEQFVKNEIVDQVGSSYYIRNYQYKEKKFKNGNVEFTLTLSSYVDGSYKVFTEETKKFSVTEDFYNARMKFIRYNMANKFEKYKLLKSIVDDKECDYSHIENYLNTRSKQNETEILGYFYTLAL